MRSIFLAATLCALALTAGAQDLLNVDSAHCVVLFENEHLRVLLMRYGPGEKSPMYERRPGFIIALTDRDERVTVEDGSSGEENIAAGNISPTEPGKQASQNIGDRPYEVLLVEYKTAEAMKAVPGLERHAYSRAEANEASALSSLRTINTAEVTFAATYEKGFTDGLNRLGEPRQGVADSENADLLDPVLAGRSIGGSNLGLVKSGYRFTYTPGPGGFGSIASYSLVARPLEYGVTGKRSFYTDETAVIRATSDDRAATVDDPPV